MSVAIAVIDGTRAYLASDRQATNQLTLQIDEGNVVKQTAFNSRVAVAFAGSQQVAQFILKRMEAGHKLYGLAKYDGVTIHEMGAVLDDYMLAYAQQDPDDDLTECSVTALIAGIDEYDRPMIAQWDSISGAFATCYHSGSRRPTVVFLRPPDVSTYEITVFGNQLMPVAMQAGMEEYLRQFIERISRRSLFVGKDYSFWECGAQESCGL